MLFYQLGNNRGFVMLWQSVRINKFSFFISTKKILVLYLTQSFPVGSS